MQEFLRFSKEYIIWLLIMITTSVVIMISNLPSNTSLSVRFFSFVCIHFFIGLWLRHKSRPATHAYLYGTLNILFIILNQAPDFTNWTIPVIYTISIIVGVLIGYCYQRSSYKIVLIGCIILLQAGMTWNGFAWIRYHTFDWKKPNEKAADQLLETVTLINTENRQVSLPNSKPILISLYFNGCASCWKQHEQLPLIQQKVQQAGYQLDIGIIHSEKRETFDHFKRMLIRMHNTVPAYFDTSRVLMPRIQLEGAPIALLLDAKGKVQRVYHGYVGDLGDSGKWWIDEVADHAIAVAKVDNAVGLTELD